MIPAPTMKDDESLRKSLVVSGTLHLAALLFLYFGLPHFYKPLPAPFVPVPFEIVEIADITNTRIKQEQEPPKPPAPPPKPEVKAAPAPPPQPAPQPKAEEQVEALLPKPSEKPKPPAPAKPREDALASVLKDVSKMKSAEATKTPDQKSEAKDQAQSPPQSAAPALSTRLTISEEDALRRQVEQCWNPPIGARDAQNLIVEVTINVNPDRTVQSAEVVDKSRMAVDPYFRAAGEAALRAIYNPKCSPLELPADKYEQWKAIDFTFDPRDML
jgi:outer membrane biosynthesis protein TonB